jgi:uncharacterized membrane protein
MIRSGTGESIPLLDPNAPSYVDRFGAFLPPGLTTIATHSVFDQSLFAVIIVSIIWTIVLPGICIIIGSIYFHNDCEKPLAIFLIVAGGATIANVLVRFALDSISSVDGELIRSTNGISIILSLFEVAWMITGAVWVYSMDSAYKVTCPVVLYSFTWYFCTLAAVLLGTIGIFAILSMCCICVYDRWRDRE